MSQATAQSAPSSSPVMQQRSTDAGTRTRWEWRSSFAVRNAMIVLVSIATLWALQWAKVFVIPCVVAICMTFWLMPLVDRLERIYVPRGFGAAIVLFGLMGAIGFTGYVLRDDARDFAAGLPRAAHHARMVFNQAAHDPNGWIHHVRNTLNERPTVESKARAPAAAVENATDIQEVVVRGSTTAIAAAANVAVVLFLIYFMLSSGDLFKRKLLAVISTPSPVEPPTTGARISRGRITVEILNEIGVQFQRYLAVLAVTNIAIGLLTWAAFAALGVEHAAVWGAAAAILHIIPYVGPAIIAGASFLVTTLQFDSISQALVVALTVVLIFELIGMALTTWLSSRASKMNSVAVFVGLMFWGWMWGIPGLLLGTPLLMATKVMADRIDCLNWLGTFLGDAPKRERKLATANGESADEVPAATATAMTEGAALGDAAYVVGEVASETTVIARDLPNDLSDDASAAESDETALTRPTKLFGVSPLPA